jgi:hypothetical protein
MPTIENPGTAPWGLNISDDDFAKLKRGVRSREMEDKWRFVKDARDLALGEEAIKNLGPEDAAPASNGTTNDAQTSEETAWWADGENDWDDEITIGTEDDVDDERAVDEIMQYAREIAQRAREERAADAAVDPTHGGSISIRRSWTDRELYVLHLTPRVSDTTGPRIEAITWEKDFCDGTTEEQAKIDAVLLCRQIAGCELAEAPEYHPFMMSGFPQAWVPGEEGPGGDADPMVTSSIVHSLIGHDARQRMAREGAGEDDAADRAAGSD